MSNIVRHASSYKSLDAAAMKRFVAWLEERDSGIQPSYHYSGRCMFGATCFGLVGDLADIQSALMEFAFAHPDAQDAIARLVRTQRRDEMGRDMIVYFPDVDISD